MLSTVIAHYVFNSVNTHDIYFNIIPIRIRLDIKVKKVKFTLEQAMKAQRGSRGIALLFL
jgi:hypothetical protein